MRRLIGQFVLLLVVLQAAACSGAVPVVEVGSPAPTVRLNDVSGQTMGLEELRGAVVLLNFWALWCEPCKAEMPEFQAAWEQYGADGLRVVTVDLGDAPADVKEYIEQRGYTFIALVDPKLTLRRSYDTRILPLSLLIDREGLVQYQRATPFEPGDLTRRIEELLGSPIAQATGTPEVPAGDTPAPTVARSQTPPPTEKPSVTPSPTRSARPVLTPTPSPSKPVEPTATRPPATRTATRTATRAPTATPTATEVPPTATEPWVPRPTDTPWPTATPTLTPSPTATPTPTEPTEPPVYGVSLGGETDKTAYREVWVEFLGELVNTGNVTDTFLIGLAIQTRGWEAKYCIGPACYDYTVPSMPVTVPADGHQAVSVKLKPPADAQEGDLRTGRLRATSQSDPGVTADWQVRATVDIP